MKLKINLFGDIFKHNLVNGEISSTQGKEPKHIKYVDDGSGEINLFVDRAIYDVEKVNNTKKNYGWLLESKAIAPELIDYFKSKNNNLNKFENIFTHNKKLIELNDKFKFLFPIGYWVEDSSEFIKSKLISMILSDKQFTEQQKARNKFAKKYHKKIDIFGSGFHYLEKKDIGLINYYFSVVYENDLTNDYFSEKILDCFATKTIPIYSGAKNIENYFDSDGIIFIEDFKFSDLSPELYKNKLESVESNHSKVIDYRTPEDKLYLDYLI